MPLPAQHVAAIASSSSTSDSPLGGPIVVINTLGRLHGEQLNGARNGAAAIAASSPRLGRAFEESMAGAMAGSTQQDRIDVGLAQEKIVPLPPAAINDAVGNAIGNALDTTTLPVHMTTPCSPRLDRATVASTIATQPPPHVVVPSREYILYLEPAPQTALYRSVLEFFRRSREAFGANEAHMYHPHTSVTGFFRVPMVDGDSVEGSDVHADDILHFLDQELGKITTAAPLLDIAHGPIEWRGNNSHLSISIRAPQQLRDVVGSMQRWHEKRLRSILDYGKTLTADQSRFIAEHTAFRVRPKPIDHISLAYRRLPSKGGPSNTSTPTPQRPLWMLRQGSSVNGESSDSLDAPNYTPVESPSAALMRSSSRLNFNDATASASLSSVECQLTADTLRALHRLAVDTLDLTSPVDQWHLVFYEVERKSDIVTVPHAFRELRRYCVGRRPNNGSEDA